MSFSVDDLSLYVMKDIGNKVMFIHSMMNKNVSLVSVELTKFVTL